MSIAEFCVVREDAGLDRTGIFQGTFPAGGMMCAKVWICDLAPGGFGKL